MATSTKRGQLRLTSRRAYQGLAKKRRDIRKSPSYLKMEQSKVALQRRYKKLKEEGNTGAITATVCTATGGAAAGALGVYVPPIMGVVPVPALVGLGLVLFGATGKASSKMHSGAACVGGGMLAKVVGDIVENMAEGMAPAAATAVAQ